MAQTYDVSLKALFLRNSSGIIRRKVFGSGGIAQVLPTEQPQVFNHRADLVARTEDGIVHHLEFQAKNENVFPRRMLGYYVYYEGVYGEHVVQTVLYIGREPLRMPDFYVTPCLQFRYTIVNLRELDAEPLLESPDWVDNVLALLAKGSPERVLEIVLPRIRAMQGEEQELAAGTLTLLSGILGMEETLNERLREIGMIDVMENKILGPAILKGLEQGRQEGRQEGLQEGLQQGKQGLLRELLASKFGTLPTWASTRVSAGSDAEIERWAKRILNSESLEDTLR
jgi:hypothetical protein